jgi:hypothetical protein
MLDPTSFLMPFATSCALDCGEMIDASRSGEYGVGHGAVVGPENGISGSPSKDTGVRTQSWASVS